MNRSLRFLFESRLIARCLATKTRPSNKVITSSEVDVKGEIVTTMAKEGEPMLGINVLEGGSDPIARHISDYPEWLVTETTRKKGIEILLESGKLENPDFIPGRDEMRLVNKARIRKRNEELRKV